MKKLLPFFLLLCLAAPFALTYSYLKLEKHQLKRSIKHKIIESIDKSELVLLQFTKKVAEEKLDWEHSKEFEFENEMYDVVEKAETTDSIFYWCWWDYEETQLNRQLAGILIFTWQQNNAQQQQSAQLIQYTKNWFSETSTPSAPKNQFEVCTTNFTPYINNHQDFQTDIPAPPPKFT